MTAPHEATYVVVDVETTGLSPERNRLTEIACVVVQGGEIVAEHRTLVNPEQSIPKIVQEMTGITNAMAFTAPRAGAVLPEVRKWFPEGAVIVGHNVQFDMGFLQNSFVRHGVRPLDAPTLCTMRLARRLLAGPKRWNLHSLAGHLGVKVHGRHQALGDARATARVLVSMLDIAADRELCDTVEEFIAIQNRRIDAFGGGRRVNPGVAATLALLPERPGVYLMLDRRGEVLYVGKAKSLRDRVGGYFRAGAVHSRRIDEMVERVRAVETRETPTELGALLLESQLIKEQQPRYNTMQKRYRRYAFVRLDLTASFPRPTLATDVEADGAEYYGPFSGRSGAEALIETINRTFRLRQCPDATFQPAHDVVPCIYGQMGRCIAPCTTGATEAEYRGEVERVREFLAGDRDGVIGLLQRAMDEKAEALEFEEAAEIRNQLRELERMAAAGERVARAINQHNGIVVLPAGDGRSREVLFLRRGRLIHEMRIGSRLPVRTLERNIARIYGDDSAARQRYGREGIDAVRIIATYIHQHRDVGGRVMVEEGEDAAAIVERLVLALRCGTVPRAYGDG